MKNRATLEKMVQVDTHGNHVCADCGAHGGIVSVSSFFNADRQMYIQSLHGRLSIWVSLSA